MSKAGAVNFMAPAFLLLSDADALEIGIICAQLYSIKHVALRMGHHWR